jgi:PadR family transcriptional regulator, regulatory protein PadR
VAGLIISLLEQRFPGIAEDRWRTAVDVATPKKYFCICTIKYCIFTLYNHLKYISMLQTDLIKGSIRTIVLKLLKENGRMYGYEITRKVEELTSGRIKLTYGALYPVLHKLESEGALVTEAENYNNRIRIYYSLTTKASRWSLKRSGKCWSSLSHSRALSIRRPVRAMPELTFQDIDRIRRDVKGQDICFSHLADELLDHLCCDVEQEMACGLNFSEAYRRVKEKMGHRRLKEIQEETFMQLTLNTGI